jgi:hypothetical protein
MVSCYPQSDRATQRSSSPSAIHSTPRASVYSTCAPMGPPRAWSRVRLEKTWHRRPRCAHAEHVRQQCSLKNSIDEHYRSCPGQTCSHWRSGVEYIQANNLGCTLVEIQTDFSLAVLALFHKLYKQSCVRMQLTIRVGNRVSDMRFIAPMFASHAVSTTGLPCRLPRVNHLFIGDARPSRSPRIGLSRLQGQLKS